MEGADALDVGFAVGDGVMSLAAVVVVVVAASCFGGSRSCN
mgnify:CR=1 FL=1